MGEKAKGYCTDSPETRGLCPLFCAKHSLKAENYSLDASSIFARS